MRGVIKILVSVLFVMLVGGLLVVGSGRVRHAATLATCQNNLKQIGIALHSYQATCNYFPTGTVPNAALAPEKWLSWVIQIWPHYIEGGISSHFDKTKAWDAQVNCPVWCSVRTGMRGETEEHLVRELKTFLCPANPARSGPDLPSLMHYPGIAGVGESAAELPLSDKRAGFFGYDRKLSPEDIKDGLSTTLTLAEALDGGPWTAGGRATVRGLADNGVPYLGEGGQFASLHRGSDLFSFSPPIVTNVLFADGSVRRFTPAVSPSVFEALATIAGGEKVGFLPE